MQKQQYKIIRNVKNQRNISSQKENNNSPTTDLKSMIFVNLVDKEFNIEILKKLSEL